MKISEINIYPIKSLGGISLNESIVEKRGLRFDRRWMLVDENADLITQREFSKMATISVEILDDGLRVSTKDFDSLEIPYKPNFPETIKVRVWDSFCPALVLENNINEWFSEVLQTKARLVYMPDETKREINKTFNAGGEIVSFADGYPLLVINENSLKTLNEKLEKKIPMNRFRPNLVVEGAEGFSEDVWKKIKIGKTVFRATKPCARCVITTIDQQTGISDIKEPLKTLAKFRKALEVYPNNYEKLGLDKNSVLFGQNLVAENTGEIIKFGDEIVVIE
jgi:uncharacterized protein YcbX